MDANELSAIAAAVLSLLFSYVPGLDAWYAALQPAVKRLLMLALVLVVAAGSYALACYGWADAMGIGVTCDQEGALGLLRAVIAALVANQSIYLVSPPTARVRQARARG